MNDEHKNFSVWLFRERHWTEGDAGRRIAGGFDEPAEAADFAEARLKLLGVEGQSYCEIRFNGEPKPHTVICYMDDGEFGIWNTEAVRWPIFYADSGGDNMLADFPFEIAEDGNQWQQTDESDNKQKSEDEGNIKLDEIEDNDDEEVEGDEDEIESQDEEDETDAEEEDSAEPKEDSGEDAEDDSGDDPDESSGDEDEDFPEDEDDGEDSDDEEDESDSEDDDLEEEEEIEMPRLRIFAKFRGPLGWRKRAEAEELQERNTFALKLGILDEESEKTKDQEKETFLELQFIESEDTRDHGLLRMKLPEGIEWSEPTKAGWITAKIPYREDA